MLTMSNGIERVCVWLGGAIFVASLACFAYFYLIQWTSMRRAFVDLLGPGAVDPRQAATVDALLLTVFAVHHSLFAREPVKQWLARAIPAGLIRTTYVSVASLLLCAVCFLWQPIGRDLYLVTGWGAALFAGVQLFGVGLIARSVRGIDALELAGIRSGPSPLQVEGPYGSVRHPVYSGFLLAVLGAAHMTADRLAFGLFSCAYIVVAIPWEERALEHTYPDEYDAYRRRVRWRVVPYLY
jgi:methanethiol S-methyltransferase